MEANGGEDWGGKEENAYVFKIVSWKIRKKILKSKNEKSVFCYFLLDCSKCSIEILLLELLNYSDSLPSYHLASCL